ncbi:MAG: 2OG-Fe dioxygenase family protein [Methylophilaceae bacterium]
MTQSGFCFAPSAAMQAWLLAQSVDALGDWERFAASWNDMPLDEYMADGGRYRRRRYATLSAASGNSDVVLEPHQPHYQSLDYNNLNGGIARDFEPILDDIVQGPTMRNVLSFGLQTFSHFMPKAKWHIECHQFRIEAQTGEAGQPTPEGVHRDGVDFVLVMMVKRENISSGTTTMHDLEQKGLDSFTLTQPLDCAIVNDRRCMHGVTPIEPINVNQPAYRDVLVVTFRNVA